MDRDFEEISLSLERPPKGLEVSSLLIPQEEIVEYFSASSSKNMVVEGFVKYGSVCFSNLAVFSVFSKSIQFLRGKGENVRKNPYVGSLNIDANSVVRRTVLSRLPYRGSIPVGMDEKTVFGKYFNRYAERIYLYPGNIRGEGVDILFYADDAKGPKGQSVATFEYVVEKTLLAFRFLWVRQQLNAI